MARKDGASIERAVGPSVGHADRVEMARDVIVTRDAVILAGGLGTRLAGAAGAVPKALAAIAGRPFLDWQLEYLETQGIERVVMAVGHRALQIVERYGPRFGPIALRYAWERTPLGTGGAIRFAMLQEGLCKAFVLNGDTMLPMALETLEGEPGDDIVLAGRALRDAARYGALTLQGERLIGFREKGHAGPGIINGGVYWLRSEALDRWPLSTAFSFEHDVLAAHAAELRTRVVVVEAPFIDIGTPESLAAAQSDIPAFMARGAGERTHD